jgi:uncharacterized protein YbjT (DUF2867 family)
VGRFLYLSYPGASPESANPFLRAKGLAEREIAQSGLEHVVVRCTHVYGPESPWVEALAEQAARWPAMVVGTGRQVLAPLFVDDVAAVLIAADDRQRVASGIWGLQGPDRLTMDELFALLTGRKRRPLHLGPRAAAALARLRGRTVVPAALAILAGDSLADAPDAAAEFRVKLTPLRDGMARSRLGRAASTRGGAQGVSAPE